MNLLPNEIIIEISNYIQKITDKRLFSRTSKFHKKITEQSILKIENDYKIPNFTYDNYCIEKFTIELCQDSYFNLIPEQYITYSNEILVLCAAYYNSISLLKLAKSKGCIMIRTTEYGAFGGHISVLEWSFDNYLDEHKSITVSAAIQCGHIHVLKWLQEHEYPFNVKSPWMCNSVSKHGYLEILKFLKKIGCVWTKYTYDYALENGNQELIKWMVDNGCPTS